MSVSAAPPIITATPIAVMQAQIAELEKDLQQPNIGPRSLVRNTEIAYPAGAYVQTVLRMNGKMQTANLFVQDFKLCGTQPVAVCGFVGGGNDLYQLSHLQYPEYEKHERCFGYYNNAWIAVKVVGKLRGYSNIWVCPNLVKKQQRLPYWYGYAIGGPSNVLIRFSGKELRIDKWQNKLEADQLDKDTARAKELSLNEVSNGNVFLFLIFFFSNFLFF